MSATPTAGETIELGTDEETVTVDVDDHPDKEYQLTLALDTENAEFAVQNGVAVALDDRLPPSWCEAVLYRLGVTQEVADGEKPGDRLSVVVSGQAPSGAHRT